MENLVDHLNSHGIDHSLATLINTIAEASKVIVDTLRQGELAGALGNADKHNVQGEQQKKLDIISNDILKQQLIDSALVKSIASEEEDDVVAVIEDAPYVVAFDPLDGSSNIDVNGQVGTIFTVFASQTNLPASSQEQFFQSGRRQLCAGYVLYGPATQLVLATSGQVDLFALEPKSQQFLVSKVKLQIPEVGHVYSINVANERLWESSCKNYINQLQDEKERPSGQQLTMRWNGAMVGDVHRTLLQGGIFMYPSYYVDGVKKNKLRLLYEAYPMAMILEIAGGKAIADQQAILDVTLDQLHQRTAVILGSTSQVDDYLSHLS